MAKISKNAEKFPIEWDGTVKGGENKNDSIPTNYDITWGGHSVDGYTGDRKRLLNQLSRTEPNPGTFFEDYDVNGDGVINVAELTLLNNLHASGEYTFNGALLDVPGNPSVDGGNATQNGYIYNVILGGVVPPKASDGHGLNTFTWGDVNFIQEIVDGIGTGSRRARQDRLNKILDDEDKKKKLIHLICRIKGEKVYDDYTESGNIEVKVEDVELVAENIIGKVKLEIKSGV